MLWSGVARQSVFYWPHGLAGVDVLEVLKNLDVFAACYAHSLHAQIFVERPVAAAGSQLHTLGLAHLEAAIRAHGWGLVPAALNAAYQLLARNFVKLSQVRQRL